MTCLKRTEQNGSDKPVGSITTDFDEIDNILQRVWKNITHGTNKVLKDVTTEFFAKYNKYIYRAPEFSLNKITAKDIKYICSMTW